jgi:fructose-bisphosphate aldolase class II
VTRALGSQIVPTYRTRSFAIAAFNVSNLETGQAVVAAAEAVGAPVILQLSPGAITYAGYDDLTRLAFDLADRATVPVVVHLDHCTDPDVVRRAIADGFGSVMFDGSRLPFDDNVARTAELVARAHPAGVTVEAELGLIGGREDTTAAQAYAQQTTPELARRFIERTGADILAPAIGSVHRMPDDSVELDTASISAIADAADRPLALHGGSGVVRSQLRELVEAGIAKINVSSRVSRALANGIRAVWAADADAVDLRRFLGAGRDAVRAMALEYLTLSAGYGHLDAPPALPRWSGSIGEPE